MRPLWWKRSAAIDPISQFFGCAGPRMQKAGVRPVVDAHSLAVVGLVEVITHIPRIYGEYRKLLNAARAERPEVAILTDSPDFHLRVARQLKKLGIPVFYLVAPQVWAWRKGRLPLMRRTIDRLLCIFPFEPEFFARHGIHATYIGHPLTRLVKPSASRAELRRRFGYPDGTPAGGPASRQPHGRGRAPFADLAGRGGTPAGQRQELRRASSWRSRPVPYRRDQISGNGFPRRPSNCLREKPGMCSSART